MSAWRSRCSSVGGRGLGFALSGLALMTRRAGMPIAEKDVRWVAAAEDRPAGAALSAGHLRGLTDDRQAHVQTAAGDQVTEQFPEQQPKLPANYRGVHRLNRDEEGRVKCVACYMCSTACPAHCIDIVAAPSPWPDREKYPETFVIDELRCIYCGMCEEACPWTPSS